MKLLYGMMMQGATFDVVAIPEEMLMKLKNTDLFLLKRLLIMMKICWRNSWKMKTLLEEINKALRAAVMDMAHSMIAGSSFKK
jgi:hypothetical protein